MLEAERRKMVEAQIIARGVTHSEVIEAMLEVPRHEFVPGIERTEAYEDHPLPIGFGQTISQPYIVALMLELSEPSIHKRLLEIGSGCGYLLAVASKLFHDVVGIERIEGLCHNSTEHLAKLKVRNAHVVCGDGYEGSAQFQPYGSIIISCCCSHPPQPLLDQLAPGGVMVAPVGDLFFQELMIIRREEDGRYITTSGGGVRFVPLVSPHDPR
jgi:protein-L-isoaspartate(D-aspartate) O-methyltransferase